MGREVCSTSGKSPIGSENKGNRARISLYLLKKLSIVSREEPLHKAHPKKALPSQRAPWLEREPAPAKVASGSPTAPSWTLRWQDPFVPDTQEL